MAGSGYKRTGVDGDRGRMSCKGCEGEGRGVGFMTEGAEGPLGTAGGGSIWRQVAMLILIKHPFLLPSPLRSTGITTII